jgi:transcriptional regulator with XRE-family HTH domain
MKHFLLTPQLCKAARALLEWQQADLAKAAHLSLTAVNNFERKIGTTRDSTLLAIQNAFEEHGVEFLRGGGLRHIDDVAEVTRFSGKGFINDWTYHAIQGGANPGEEILTASCDEEQWYAPQNLQSTKDFLAWIERCNLKLKLLVSDNAKPPQRPLRNYRAVPPEMIGKITYCIYGQKIGFVLWKKKQIIVLHNAAVAETFRNQFNYLWKIGKPVH